MRDITAILMGDPEATFRRPPTPTEACMYYSGPGDQTKRKKRGRTATIWKLEVGDRHHVDTKAKAISAYQRMIRAGLGARMEKSGSGYDIVRLR